MEYEEAKKRLAPCGLDCSRCADYEDGEIKKTSALLTELLGNYRRLAKMKADAVPAFRGYDQFQEVLTSFVGAACSGCRGNHVLCPTRCAARTCHKEEKVDFCFECGKYPCENQFEGKLRERWLSINNRMKEVGPAAYCEEQSKLSRY